MKFTVSIPDNLNAFDREAVGERLVRLIKERTEAGIDSNGQPFAGYSQSYVNSKDFQIAGKSPSKVNLRLSDEMMESLQIVDSGTGFVTLGFTNADADKKAEWNAASDNGPSREFLGVSQAELDSVLSDFVAEEPTVVSESLTSRILEAARRRILDGDN